MAESLFNVVFTGELAAGMNAEQVYEDLARTFRIPSENVRAIFRGSGSVVRKNVDRATAEKYREFIERLGARCRLEEIAQAAPREEDVPEMAKAENEFGGTRIIDIKPMNAKLQYTPMRINRLTGGDDGIHLHRGERDFVPWGDIVALSTVRLEKAATGHTVLLFLVRGGQRPYAVDANLIAFAEFPDVTDASTEVSLRNFLVYLFSKNSSIVCDSITMNFVGSGGKVASVNDLVAQATALAEALGEMGQGAAEN